MKKISTLFLKNQLQICLVATILGFLSLSVHFFNLVEENKQLKIKILELQKKQLSLTKQIK